MRLMERPIHNIRNIKVDWKLIVWVLFWMILLIVLIIPSQALEGISDAIRFMFTFGFYDLKDSAVSTDGVQPTPKFDEVRNRLYIVMNIGKVVFWFVTGWIIGTFLFKKPDIKSETEQ